MSSEALLASANFTLSLLPSRLAHRIHCLRSLPFIIVSNPNISRIYNNYIHSLSTLLPYQQRQITTLEEERVFTDVMADLVQTHANTIPVLAQGFLECRKYIKPEEVTAFLDEHLRARIGTRLIAEQHIALHMSSLEAQDGGEKSARSQEEEGEGSYIGVIDTALKPAQIVRSCETFVSEICELKYGVRPNLVINGEVDASFAHVPVHLEYIITELLKNAFRATLESGNEKEAIEVTIAAAPDVPQKTALGDIKEAVHAQDHTVWTNNIGNAAFPSSTSTGNISPFKTASREQGITIRIRDRGGGIPPETLPKIWSYSFTTFGEESNDGAGYATGTAPTGGNMDALNALSNGGPNQSSIAGLGYGLPLGRAYAEYFGGGIALQSLWGWGTDVYLTLQGVGKID